MSGAADGRAVLLVLAVQPAPIMFPVLLEEGPVNHPLRKKATGYYGVGNKNAVAA